MLVGGVGVKLECPVVVAEIARIRAAEQAVALDREALAVGGGSAAVAPQAAESPFENCSLVGEPS